MPIYMGVIDVAIIRYFIYVYILHRKQYNKFTES